MSLYSLVLIFSLKASWFYFTNFSILFTAFASFIFSLLVELKGFDIGPVDKSWLSAFFWNVLFFYDGTNFFLCITDWEWIFGLFSESLFGWVICLRFFWGILILTFLFILVGLFKGLRLFCWCWWFMNSFVRLGSRSKCVFLIYT